MRPNKKQHNMVTFNGRDSTYWTSVACLEFRKTSTPSFSTSEMSELIHVCQLNMTFEQEFISSSVNNFFISFSKDSTIFHGLLVFDTESSSYKQKVSEFSACLILHITVFLIMHSINSRLSLTSWLSRRTFLSGHQHRPRSSPVSMDSLSASLVCMLWD